MLPIESVKLVDVVKAKGCGDILFNLQKNHLFLINIFPILLIFLKI